MFDVKDVPSINNPEMMCTTPTELEIPICDGSASYVEVILRRCRYLCVFLFWWKYFCYPSSALGWFKDRRERRSKNNKNNSRKKRKTSASVDQIRGSQSDRREREKF